MTFGVFLDLLLLPCLGPALSTMAYLANILLPGFHPIIFEITDSLAPLERLVLAAVPRIEKTRSIALIVIAALSSGGLRRKDATIAMLSGSKTTPTGAAGEIPVIPYWICRRNSKSRTSKQDLRASRVAGKTGQEYKIS